MPVTRIPNDEPTKSRVLSQQAATLSDSELLAILFRHGRHPERMQDLSMRLLEQFGSIPTIFITAFPERLLTGEKPEPAFLIAKPYSEEQVRSAISQAMFFSSTETLRA